MELKGKTLEGNTVFFELCDIGPFDLDCDIAYYRGTPLVYSSIVSADSTQQRFQPNNTIEGGRPWDIQANGDK